ncbi:aldo/keto reductase [Streptomyces sp. NPDC015125]|uniref:aldo/keto reductase n=1 Tax=Streptomyces sp. NPDC015125 TaxID=3364938 RepID=UPI0036F968F6
MRAPDPGIILGLHRSRHERRLLTEALSLGIRRIDTSYNYLNFSSHSILSAALGDLLDQFTVSTKVGFFARGSAAAEHSLDPARLRLALEQTNRDLQRAPDLVFLHNPERSLHGSPDSARDALAQACGALEDAAASGLCRAWGIATWNPAPLSAAVDITLPRPSAFMVRAGLLVGIDALDAADALATLWNLGTGQRWGMSPFGGNASSSVWEALDPRMFLQDPAGGASRIQAAFRAAYVLPRVGAVAVGSDDAVHLRELVAALAYDADDAVITQYRELLRQRSRAHRA